MFSPTKLKEKRESQGLSQSQLASSLGISRASYFNWESGKTKPNQNNLSKLSEILNVDPRYFESEYEIVETYLKLTERNQEATLHYATELLNKQNAKVVEIPERFAYKVYEKLSAGTGTAYFDDGNYDTVYFNHQFDYDFASWVFGNSMEPTYEDGSVALNIAKPYIQEHTEIVPVVFPMVLDDATQQEGWEEAKRIIVSYLEQGKKVVFLTLGDPMFYSTYMYVYRLIEHTGFEIETIPGITAFCAIGSHLGYPIVEKEEVLAIVPATAPKEKIDAVLAVADDAVIMKVYKNFDEVQEVLLKHNMADDAVMISRVGLPDEQVFVGLDNMPKDKKLNYLSTVLAKRKDR